MRMCPATGKTTARFVSLNKRSSSLPSQPDSLERDGHEMMDLVCTQGRKRRMTLSFPLAFV